LIEVFFLLTAFYQSTRFVVGMLKVYAEEHTELPLAIAD